MPRSFAFLHLACLFACLFFSGCAGTPPYVYHYVPGRTAVPQGSYVVPPPAAPEPVLLAVAAGNRIAGLPYGYGGGHGSGQDRAYDCSGSASYVLQAAGLLRTPMPSEGFRHYGADGAGQWISVYARRGHVFLVVAGLRFDTGWSGDSSSGPRWTTHTRPASGCVIRHPPGL